MNLEELLHKFLSIEGAKISAAGNYYIFEVGNHIFQPNNCMTLPYQVFDAILYFNSAGKYNEKTNTSN